MLTFRTHPPQHGLQLPSGGPSEAETGVQIAIVSAVTIPEKLVLIPSDIVFVLLLLCLN